MSIAKTAEQDMAWTIRDFIVRSVGEDMGAGMTLQADELTDLLMPILANAWSEGAEWERSQWGPSNDEPTPRIQSANPYAR